MKWYKDLKVSVKLILGFALVIALAAFIGIFGRVKLRETRISYTSIFESYGNAQGYLGYILNSFEEEYIAMSDILLYNTPEDTEECLGALAEARANMELYLPLYEATTRNSEEERAEYDTIVEQIDAFHGLLDTYLTALDAGDVYTAEEIFTSDEMDTTSVLLTELLFDKLENTVTRGQEVLLLQETATKRIEMIMLAVMCASLLMAILCVFIVSRSVSVPLNAISAAADQLAAGDTNVQVSAYIGKDETGRTAKAFDGVVKAIRALSNDTRSLSGAATHGDLKKRADASLHQGEYREIVEGINGTLDAIVFPIQAAADVLDEMARGNLSARVQGEFEGDHGLIQRSLNNTLDSLNSYIHEIQDVLSAMADGDLTIAITSDFQGDFAVLKHSINNIAQELCDVMAGINEAAEQVATGTNHVAAGANAVSQGAMEQSESIETLTTAVSAIVEQIQNTAEHAGHMRTQSGQALEYAENGSSQMQTMQKAMEEISNASDNISKIIKTIDDIAFQTNILSLNAAVEAARAGAHGKGFAVVAEEVRNLAGKSAHAASNTSALIESTVEKAHAGTEIANATAGGLTRIVEAVQVSAATVDEIAHAANEQAMGIEQVNRGIAQMSQVVQSNSATAEETAAAAQELSGQAALLKEMVRRFQISSSRRGPLLLNEKN